MSPEPSDSSISEWIAGLKAGEHEAARCVWNRYASRLVEVAHDRLGGLPRRIVDEEDLALSAFRSLCSGAAAGRFPRLSGRDELWWLLLAITRRKATDLKRRDAVASGGPRVLAATDLGGQNDERPGFCFDEMASPELSPEVAAILAEEQRRLLNLLRDERLRLVALWRIEGCSVREIAGRLGIGTRSVERKLRLIREKWARELRV